MLGGGGRGMARLSTSRVPTTWAAPVTVRASTNRKIRPRRRTGTPRAAAASGSMEANSSGRYQVAMTATTTRPIATRMSRPAASRRATAAYLCSGMAVPGPAGKAGRKRRSRRLLVTTNTELNAIAAAAISGLRNPSAASGMAAVL